MANDAVDFGFGQEQHGSFSLGIIVLSSQYTAY